ncbi:MAG: Ig-like domain-containing protein [Lachnospiraceae bacterium]|nr:Ig-like domain-containing protein [Lachnospiraceae bacterium]
MRSLRKAICLAIITVLACGVFGGCSRSSSSSSSTPGEQTEKELPKPEITGGARGEFGIDKNINEATIDEYLGRGDAVYRDMRMLEDPAEYENIGGDRYLSGYVDGFEVVPLPYIIPVYNLPGAVGETYTGDTLFSGNSGWMFTPNFEESMSIIEELFPKDKVIFLMCGGGGYAGMMKTFLISMGWDPDMVYNVGGYWFYDGDHNVEIKKEENGQVSYDFENVHYHDIDFSKLTPIPESEDVEEVSVTGIWLNTNRTELEEDMSFQLSAIVLPNEASNKMTEWTSSDPAIAYIDDSGLLRGMGPGTATISVKTDDGGFTASCEVTVAAKESTEHLKLDDVSEEAEAFKASDPNAIMHELDWIDEDPERAVREGYYETDGVGYMVTDLWREAYEKDLQRAEEAAAARTEILNSLADGGKSFILLIYTNNCEIREYQAAEGAVKILEEAGIPYFYTNDIVSEYDRSLYNSHIDYNKAVASSVVIMKDGQIYAGLDPDAYSLKNDEDLRNWLEKYIDLDK